MAVCLLHRYSLAGPGLRKSIIENNGRRDKFEFIAAGIFAAVSFMHKKFPLRGIEALKYSRLKLLLSEKINCFIYFAFMI